MSEFEFEPGVSNTTLAVVSASQRITPESTDEVRQIQLHIDEPSFYFLEGQSVGVVTPGPHPYGNKLHHRYYTIAKAAPVGDGVDLELLVRRCFYIDDVSGEQYPGEASNYLCDAKTGDAVTLTGPYHSPFKIPADSTSNLLMLGTGTGIAPFRAFLRRIYDEQKGWKGQVRLFFGARDGTGMLYMNDLNNDLAHYYDQDTFRAIQSVRGAILDDAGDALKRGVEGHVDAIWSLLQSAKTHVYLAGMKKAATAFDAAMAKKAGSDEAWQAIKQGLIEDKRWTELTYH
ncbi:MAG: oxidoreductase [Hydrogenophilales bacterium]|nr:oxidoreductase [Hydrogenophilales bacterium]